MAALFQRAGVAVMAGLGIAMAAVGGFAAGFSSRTDLNSRADLHPRTILNSHAVLNSRAILKASDLAGMSAADTVSLRFPNDWTEAETTSSVPMRLAFASADAALPLFDPKPIYSFGTETASLDSSDAPERQIMPGQLTAAAAAKPAVAATRPVPRSNAVLNESQIASIKKRLNLTRDQQRYWPAVEAELRKMEYKKDQKSGTRTATIDMSKVNVEGLKSAGFPLVMSFSEDQKRELKSLTHLLGLESVMSTL
jgi:hypothetical protein